MNIVSTCALMLLMLAASGYKEKTEFLGLRVDYFDEDGNATDDLFYVTTSLDEKIRDLTQFEEDMNKETDYLYIMGDIHTEQDLEDAIDSFIGIKEGIDYSDPNYQEIVVVPEDQLLDDATEIKIEDLIKDLGNNESSEDVFG